MSAEAPGRRGILLALASAALFGTSTPVAKALLGTMPPLALAGLLYAGAGLGLAAVLLIRRLVSRDPAPIAWPKRADAAWLAAAIALGGVAGPIALMSGLVTTTASAASLLLNLEAVFTALLAWFLFRENVDRRVALGMLAIVAGGVVLASAPAGPEGVSAGTWLVALACLCWALDNNLTRRASGSDAVAIAMLKGLVAGAVTLLLARAQGASLPPVALTVAAAAVGFLGYGVSLALFVLALRDLGTARTGAYYSVAPFFGALLAVAGLSEPVTWQLAVAGTLMALGVWLHVTERHSHRHAHARLEHEHPHVHDEHHRHGHDFAWDGREPHSHPHVHEPLVHSHPHYPDLHHRHPH